MTAPTKVELERLERHYGLKPDGLTYQHRCSRIAAYQQGREWELPKKEERKTYSNVKQHPLFGKKILITPLMTVDANRNLCYDEKIGHKIEVVDVAAGDMLYHQPEEVDRMVGDYKVTYENRNEPVIAKTTFPKVNTEISLTIGQDPIPVPRVRGNDGQIAYVWSFPTQIVQVPYTESDGTEAICAVQLVGLKTLIEHIAPALLQQLRGKPYIMYVDGVTMGCNIPLTNQLFEDWRIQQKKNVRAGLV